MYQRTLIILLLLVLTGVFTAPVAAITACTPGSYTVTGNVNVRAGASTSANIVTVLRPGAAVEVTGERNGTRVGTSTLWCAVIVSTSVGARNGFVHSSLLTLPAGTTGGGNQSTGTANLGSPASTDPQPGNLPALQSTVPPTGGTPPILQPTSAPPAPSNMCNGADDLNCSNFSSQAAAQAHFNLCGNEDRLDGNDNDGRACESLP